MRRLALAALAASVPMGMAAAPAGAALAARASAADVVSIPTSFAVKNVNGSGASCQSDGKPYVLHGEIVGPRAVLAGGAPATATLHLHEYGFDDFWHFRTVPGVDYASALAAAGHVSVTIDRLGYDDSPQPDGDAICIGAHADMAHQIVGQLRAGTYLPDGIAPRPFQHVVLAGHSVGAIIAELEAYSFSDVEALMLFGHSDGDYSPASLQTGVRQGSVCAQGGDGGGAPNYAFFGATPEESRDLGYHDADPAVVQAQMALRHPDPCGDVNSLIPTLVTNNERADEIKVPVLLLYGRNDATLAADAGDRQSRAYTGSTDVSTVWFENTGHALVLERVAPQIQATVGLFLTKHGFGPQVTAPAHAPAAGKPQPAPLLRLSGVRRRGCVRRAFTVRVSVLTRSGPLRWLRLTLDGRRIAQTSKRSYSKRIAAARLAPGLHRLTATAQDAAGSSTRTAATFRRCR